MGNPRRCLHAPFSPSAASMDSTRRRMRECISVCPRAEAGQASQQGGRRGQGGWAARGQPRAGGMLCWWRAAWADGVPAAAVVVVCVHVVVCKGGGVVVAAAAAAPEGWMPPRRCGRLLATRAKHARAPFMPLSGMAEVLRQMLLLQPAPPSHACPKPQTKTNTQHAHPT